MDPEADVEFHLELCEKYLGNWRSLSEEGLRASIRESMGCSFPNTQSLSYWEGRELRSHAELWEYADELAEKLSDRELRYLCRAAMLSTRILWGWILARGVDSQL